ncbi:MAG TPA: alpha-isopropylmalate synthase regulatory domain-containing protein, partial [Thermomicrobiales bacterium]|nr:alpha-isopropylmalate synthase regulatory domain-containing protein [Thermomicrobiales bacterium]
FAHEAGIHQDGMLKNRTTYEIMNPQDVGWEGTKLIVGKHSGRAGFKNALSELGLKLDDEQIQQAYLKFLELADRKKHVTAADLEALVTDSIETQGDAISLVQWKVDIASGEPATATVVLAHDGRQLVGEAEGNGPVEAMLRAIDAATGLEPELEYYNVEALGPQKDAQGTVNVRIRSGSNLYTGHGLAPDVVEASGRAYVAAINRLERNEPSTVIAGSSTSRWT